MGTSANEVTVREVLAKFDNEFAATAKAIEDGEFTLWIGSGISRQAPSLGALLERALDYLRNRALDPTTAIKFTAALEEALNLAEIDPASVRANYAAPVASWPEWSTLRDRLWTKYSKVLDIVVEGEATDFILWDAIDIREAFSHPEPPNAAHLCIAILVLEGIVEEIASANWDGFVEAAVDTLSGVASGVLQVVVDPQQLRSPKGRARLLKFHGCIIHATNEPNHFRSYLTGSHSQIIDWPESGKFSAMCTEIVSLATANKTLMLGLSLQDMNLQTVVARAKAKSAWTWPCDPAAPAYVFCEDQLQPGQRDVLRQAYGDSYNADKSDVDKASHVRAWGDKVLVALVLRVLCDKLGALASVTLADIGRTAYAADVVLLTAALRDSIADFIDPGPSAHADTTHRVKGAIEAWTRLTSIYRTGKLPKAGGGYQALSSTRPNSMLTDPNAMAMGFGKMAIALSLLQAEAASGNWVIESRISGAIEVGALKASSNRTGAPVRPIFLLKSLGESIALEQEGGYAGGNAISVLAEGKAVSSASAPSSARRVRSAPGRTGRIANTFVSLTDLLQRCPDFAALRSEFVSEIML